MTRTWPLPRIAGGPRRSSTFLLRQHAGIHRRRRVHLQCRRDEALDRLAKIDDELDRLSAERVELLEELSGLRDTLWPAMPHWKGRRPPALDRPPLPPAPAGATPARAGDMRTLCLVLLGRHGPLALPDLHALLHRYGNVIIGQRPVQALADAMRYEVRMGRAVRVARGVYDLDPELRRQGLPTWPDPPGLGDPLPWGGPQSPPSAGGTPSAGDTETDWSAVPADGEERMDPARWAGDDWPAPEGDHDTEEGPPSEPYGTESAPIRCRGVDEGGPGGRGGRDGGPRSGGTVPHRAPAGLGLGLATRRRRLRDRGPRSRRR